LERQEELVVEQAGLMLLKHEVVAEEISCGGGSSQILDFTTTLLIGARQSDYSDGNEIYTTQHTVDKDFK